MWLLAGTVPAFKKLLAGTVPAFKRLLVIPVFLQKIHDDLQKVPATLEKLGQGTCRSMKSTCHSM